MVQLRLSTALYKYVHRPYTLYRSRHNARIHRPIGRTRASAFQNQACGVAPAQNRRMGQHNPVLTHHLD
jgi:hypothetical protein